MDFYIALDVGGSSINSAIVNDSGEITSEIMSYPARSQESTQVVVDNIIDIIKKTNNLASGVTITKVAIGFPGPFDYEKGICLIRGINKYDNLYGINLKETLEKRVNKDIKFINDADMYCLGECLFGSGRDFNRVMCVSLGTGLGSGFFADGKLVKSGPYVPEGGHIFHTPFRDSIADHYVSAYGLRILMRRNKTTRALNDVKELSEAAYNKCEPAIEIFNQFGNMLAELITPFANKFSAECVILGGEISRSFNLFSDRLKNELNKTGINLMPSKEFAKSALKASPLLYRNESECVFAR